MINPQDEVLTPIDVVILFGYGNAIVQKHRFDVAFDAAQVFDQIVAPAKQASKLFLFVRGNVDAFKVACGKLFCQIGTVNLIGLVVLCLLPLGISPGLTTNTFQPAAVKEW
jgi:hypothetical protein